MQDAVDFSYEMVNSVRMMSDALMNRSKLDQEYVLKCIIVFVQERQIQRSTENITVLK